MLDESNETGGESCQMATWIEATPCAQPGTRRTEHVCADSHVVTVFSFHLQALPPRRRPTPTVYLRRLQL